MKKTIPKGNHYNRRRFLQTSVTAMAGFTILPSNVIAGLGHKAPSDKLNIAGIGIGGRGFGNMKELQSENIVALCDVDWNYSQAAFDFFPKAQKFKDWRVMYDEIGNSIDAVIDHFVESSSFSSSKVYRTFSPRISVSQA